MTFWKFLLSHTADNTLIGDFARDARSDSGFPRGRTGITSREHLLDYLEGHNACEGAILGARQAWVAFKRPSATDPATKKKGD